MKKLILIFVLFMGIPNCQAQDPQLLRTWYVISAEIDMEGIFYPPSADPSEQAQVTFLDTTDLVNVIGYSGCNAFEMEVSYNPGDENFDINNFASGTEFCSDAYDIWEEQLYYVLSPGLRIYQFSNNNGIDYLLLHHPLLSYIYLQSVPLSTDEFAKQKISIFPNPASESLHISAPNVEIETLRIMDLSGQILRENVSSDTSIDVTALASGVYFLEILAAEGKTFRRFIKE